MPTTPRTPPPPVAATPADPATRAGSPTAGNTAASPPSRPPGRPGPLVVNMPAAKVDTRSVPAVKPPDLRLPHEHDQSGVDTTAAEPDPVVVQAAKDLAAGQVDTDLHNAGGLDDARRQQLLKRQK